MTKADSEKQDKRRANRKLRRLNRVRLASDQDMAQMREVVNVYSFDKDGKQYFGDMPDDPKFTPYWKMMSK